MRTYLYTSLPVCCLSSAGHRRRTNLRPGERTRRTYPSDVERPGIRCSPVTYPHRPVSHQKAFPPNVSPKTPFVSSGASRESSTLFRGVSLTRPTRRCYNASQIAGGTTDVAVEMAVTPDPSNLTTVNTCVGSNTIMRDARGRRRREAMPPSDISRAASQTPVRTSSRRRREASTS